MNPYIFNAHGWRFWRGRLATGIGCLVVGLFGLVGCDAVDDLKQAKQTFKSVKENTQARLTELQVRGEMDFELQPVFQAFRTGYLAAWQNQVVSDWGALAEAASSANLAISEVDARRVKLQPVWGVARPETEPARSAILIGYAPREVAGQFWGLMGDGNYQKLTQAELDELLSPK